MNKYDTLPVNLNIHYVSMATNLSFCTFMGSKLNPFLTPITYVRMRHHVIYVGQPIQPMATRSRISPFRLFFLSNGFVEEKKWLNKSKKMKYLQICSEQKPSAFRNPVSKARNALRKTVPNKFDAEKQKKNRTKNENMEFP